jgi:hypothetical protein
MPEKSTHNSQEAAATFARYLATARTRRRAAWQFALDYDTERASIRKTRKLAKRHLLSLGDTTKADKSLSLEGKEKVETLYEAQLEKERGRFTSKTGEYTSKERTKLLLRARLGRVSGITPKESAKMYEEAGYKSIVTGKSFLSSAGVTAGLFAVSEGVRFGGVIFDNLVPMAEKLPAGRTGVLLSAAGYTASYTLFALESRRLTRKTGTSANASVTAAYAAGETFELPKKIRYALEVGFPVGIDALLHSAAYTALVGGVTGDSSRIVAGNLTSIGLTLGFAAGSEAWLWRKMRKDRKTNRAG